jgi:hypothetical protein
MGLNLDRKDMENGEHFPTQENHSGNRYGDRQNLAEVEVAAAGLKPPRDQAQNIQGREAKNQHPENVVDIPLFTGKLIGKLKHE